MDMLNEMAIYVKVVNHSGFSAAARELGMSTSAVSRHVTRLEQHLRGRLLHRTTRSLALTELGRQVFESCSQMVDTVRDIEAMAASYSSRPTGTIRVSAPVVLGEVWLAPALAGFLDAYPEVNVQLTLIDRVVDLIEDGVDIAIRIANDLAPGLATRKIGEVNYLLAATDAYLALHGTPVIPEDLLAHRCCFLNGKPAGDKWTLNRAGDTVSVNVPNRITVNNSAAILAFVEANGGIGLMPDLTAQQGLRRNSVRQVLPEWTLSSPQTDSVHAVYTPGRNLPLKVRVFIDYLLSINLTANSASLPQTEPHQ